MGPSLRPLWLALALVFFLSSGPPIRAHDAVPPVPMLATPSPDAVVPENGAPAPTGSLASARVELALDILDPALEYRIQLSGLDLASEVESIHIHLGAPGSNGPRALNVYGAPRQDDANLLVDLQSGFLIGIWDDDDENFGDDDVRDPEDSIAFIDAVQELLDGNVYFQVTTNAHPLPDTAELRGQVGFVPRPGVLVGQQGGQLATAAASDPDLSDVRVFESLMVFNPALGGTWTSDPRFVSSNGPPGMEPAPAGQLAFDVVSEPALATHLAYRGPEDLGFAPFPGFVQLGISGPLAGPILLDGSDTDVAGFPIGSIAADGSGLAERLEFVMQGGAPGVFLLPLMLRLETVEPGTGPTASPRFWIVIGLQVSQIDLDAARVWIEENLLADADADGVPDGFDNCTQRANPAQADGDQDGYGNACDGDFDQNLPIVGFPDLAQMRQALGRLRSRNDCPQDDGTPGGSCAEFDLDDALPVIGFPDLARFRQLLGRPPGPTCQSCLP